MSLSILDDWEYPAEPVRGGKWAKTNAVPFNCPGCGRFARVTGTRHHYNGNFNCQTLFYTCSKCGDQDLELV